MSPLLLSRPPVAEAAMLIRRPAAEVFEAFVDPTITARFWFTRGSGRLEPGARVEWEWRMYGFSIPVDVVAVEPHERIVVEWPGQEGPTTVEWSFVDRGDGTTFVTIANRGFAGDADDMVSQAVDSAGGFSFVLAGLKALLEHGVRLNLVGDRHPDGFGAG